MATPYKIRLRGNAHKTEPRWCQEATILHTIFEIPHRHTKVPWILALVNMQFVSSVVMTAAIYPPESGVARGICTPRSPLATSTAVSLTLPQGRNRRFFLQSFDPSLASDDTWLTHSTTSCRHASAPPTNTGSVVMATTSQLLPGASNAEFDDFSFVYGNFVSQTSSLSFLHGGSDVVSVDCCSMSRSTPEPKDEWWRSPSHWTGLREGALGIISRYRSDTGLQTYDKIRTIIRTNHDIIVAMRYTWNHIAFKRFLLLRLPHLFIAILEELVLSTYELCLLPLN